MQIAAISVRPQLFASSIEVRPDLVACEGQAGSGAGGDDVDVNFADAEVPGGTIDGTNVTFTLENAPDPAASLQLFLNGELLDQGDDYTLSGATITFTGADPPSGDDQLLAWYRY